MGDTAGPGGLTGRANATPLDLWIAERDGRFVAPGPAPALAEALAPLVRATAAAGEPAERDVEVTLDGTARTLRVALRPLPGAQVAVAALDLGGLHTIDRSLSRHDLVMRATNDGVWEWDIVRDQAWWNPRMYEMLGRAPGSIEPTYEAWIAGLHPDDRARVLADFERVVASGAVTWEDEYRILRPDGTSVVTLDRGYIERDASGRPLRMIGVNSDVTEQRAATAALRESEARFRQLTETIDQVFWLVSPDLGQVLYVSPGFERIFGRSCQSVYDNALSFTDAIHEDDRERIVARVAQRDLRGYDMTYRIRRPDGSIAWIRDRSFPIRDERGEVVRYAGVATDLTAQRELEEQLARVQKLDSIGRLAGGVAHDFNNLLTVILSGTRFALRRTADPSARADLAPVEEAAVRAAKLTSQLLAFARRQVVEPVRLDVNELAHQMEGLLRRVIGEHIALSTALDPAAGPVVADRGQLEQVLLNLAVNARDAMPGGGRLTIATANRSVSAADARGLPEVEPGEYVELAVADTGTGIAPEVREHMFEPFFTTKPPGQGTGLGLATSYGIVRQAGGHLLVDSATGRGATFRLLLPRAATAPEAIRERAATVDAPGGTETILFVEDDGPVRAMGVRILAEQGYRVLTAASGEEALRLAEAEGASIDLLVTDVVMPHMGGVDVCRRLRAARGDLRVLFTSGYAATAVVQGAVREAEAAFLAKPYVPETLLAKVREVLDGG